MPLATDVRQLVEPIRYPHVKVLLLIVNTIIGVKIGFNRALI